MHCDLVDALAKFGIFIGHEQGANAAVLSGPGGPPVIGAVNTASGNSDIDALLVRGIEHDGVQGEPAVGRHPARAVGMIEEATNERPGCPGIASLKRSEEHTSE